MRPFKRFKFYWQLTQSHDYLRRWRWVYSCLQMNKYFLCPQTANECLTSFSKEFLSRAIQRWEPRGRSLGAIQSKPWPPVTWKEAVWGGFFQANHAAFCLMLITKCTKVAGRSLSLLMSFFFFFLIIIDRHTDIKSKTVLIKLKLQTSCWPPRHSEGSTQLQKQMVPKKLVTSCIHLRRLAKKFPKNLFWKNVLTSILVPFMFTKQQLDKHPF